MCNHITLGLIVGALLANSVHAQTATESPTALLNRLSMPNDPAVQARAFHELKEVLQQKTHDVPRAVLDSIADRLTSIAMMPPLRDRTGGIRAISLLQLSGSADARKPYAGAFQRLIQIAERGPEIGTRAAAIGAMATLSNKRQSLSYLEKFATLSQPTALVNQALVTLASEFGDEGRRALARIDEQEGVLDRSLRRDLRLSRTSGYRFQGMSIR